MSTDPTGRRGFLQRLMAAGGLAAAGPLPNVRRAQSARDDRGDNFFSVAYWYQDRPLTDFPRLPSASARIPAVRTT